jgi:hypothetical protein
MIAHVRDSGHRACDCGGYHYKHRPGSPYCHSNPLSLLRHVLRSEEDDAAITGLAANITQERPELADQVRELCARFGIQV